MAHTFRLEITVPDEVTDSDELLTAATFDLAMGFSAAIESLSILIAETVDDGDTVVQKIGTHAEHRANQTGPWAPWNMEAVKASASDE